MASPFEALSILLLAASMLVIAGSTEPPPSGYRSELVHVDAKGGLTRHELIRRAVHRSNLRAEALSSASDATAPSATMKYSPKDAEYHMVLSIGGKPPVSVVADTGSDLTWVPKEYCDGCPLAKDDIDCDKRCHALIEDISAKCDAHWCKYQREYGEGSIATGHLVKGKFSSTGPSGQLNIGCTSAATGRIYIGCTDKFRCAPKTPQDLCGSYSASGVVGLGRGDASLVGQLKFRKFSYCLNNYLKPELNSPIFFGSLASPPPPEKAITTNLVVKGGYPSSSKYFVKMTNISMQGEDPVLINMPGGGDEGNLFVDTGMSFTHLPEEVFKVIEKKLIGDKRIPSPKNEGFSCYKGTELPNTPEMVLHLDGAEMRLPVTSYMFLDVKNEEVCLAMMQQKGNGTTAILGNFQQQDLAMHFDITHSPGKLSFARVDCRDFN